MNKLLNNIGILLALLILISLSIICHVNQWISTSEPAITLAKINNQKKESFGESTLSPDQLNTYTQMQCPNSKCQPNSCQVIPAAIPDELLASCGTGPNPVPTLSDAEIKLYLWYNYLNAAQYAMLRKYPIQ